LDLEHCRKDAKRLLRAFRAGDPSARVRVDARLGARAQTRFTLTDAQCVVAREHGHRSWPGLRRALAAPDPQRRDAVAAPAPERHDAVVETGLEYRRGDPVRIRTVHRDRRTSVTDDGAAIARAGHPPGWREAAARTARELVVNVSRHGVVSLPVVRAGPPEHEVVRRIAEASLRLYQDLLDLEGD
jgi:hypothetical protein